MTQTFIEGTNQLHSCFGSKRSLVRIQSPRPFQTTEIIQDCKSYDFPSGSQKCAHFGHKTSGNTGVGRAKFGNYQESYSSIRSDSLDRVNRAETLHLITKQSRKQLRQTSGGGRVARLNIEDEFFLAVMGMVSPAVDVDKAHGNVLRFIRLAQEKFKRHSIISDLEFERLGFLPEMVGIFAEKVDGGYRAVGDQKYFSWLLEASERGSLGGQKSAEVRKERYGSAQPRSKPEAIPKQPEAAEPSPSPSLKKKKEAEIFKPETAKELWDGVKQEKRDLWMELYPDKEFIGREIKQLFSYYTHDHPEDRPRSRTGWTRAINSWLKRGWPAQLRSKKFENRQPAYTPHAKSGPTPIRYAEFKDEPRSETRAGDPEAAAKVRELVQASLGYNPKKEGA